MTSLAERTLKHYVDVLDLRSKRFALNISDQDAIDCVLACIRKLDQVVAFPRTMYLHNPPRSVELPPEVDSIVNVKFSSEQNFNTFIKEFGLLPLISKSFPIGMMESTAEFLIYKGNLNMLARHLKIAPDWEYWPPNLVLNAAYQHVVVEYLPFLDADVEISSDGSSYILTEKDEAGKDVDISPKWVLTQTEDTYVIERAWALFNIRNAESLISAQYIGVGTEYASVLAHWEEKLKDIDKDFVAGSVITYVG